MKISVTANTAHGEAGELSLALQLCFWCFAVRPQENSSPPEPGEVAAGLSPTTSVQHHPDKQQEQYELKKC